MLIDFFFTCDNVRPPFENWKIVMSKPIFIGGYFKSGTTLLRSMLSKHSNIASGLETYWFKINLSDHEALEKKISQLAVFYDFPEEKIREIAENSESRTRFLDSFMSTVAKSQSKKRWLEKTPGNILHTDEIFENWPKAQFIYIHRDPRDICVSMFEAEKLSSIQEYAKIWSRYALAAENFLHDAKASDNRIHKLSYESLVIDSEKAIREVLLFLREPWEAAVANHTGDSGEFDKVRDVTGKESTTLQRTAKPITKSRIGLWQHAMTTEDLATLENCLSEHGSLEIFRNQLYTSEKQDI